MNIEDVIQRRREALALRRRMRVERERADARIHAAHAQAQKQRLPATGKLGAICQARRASRAWPHEALILHGEGAIR
jgi:regulator of protease activity HflC (stomatin/prohibitin superfamily)